MSLLHATKNMIKISIILMKIQYTICQQFYPYGFDSNVNTYDPTFDKFEKSGITNEIEKDSRKENSDESNEFSEESGEIKEIKETISNITEKKNTNTNQAPNMQQPEASQENIDNNLEIKKENDTQENEKKNISGINSLFTLTNNLKKEMENESAKIQSRKKSKPRITIIRSIGNPNRYFNPNRFLNLPINREHMFSSKSGMLFPPHIYNKSDQDIREEDSYSESSQNENEINKYERSGPIRSITKGKIETSQQNLNKILHRELNGVSKDLSDKVEAAIGNVSKETPSNYKEVIIIKKRILSDGKHKIVNLNVQEKVVPKDTSSFDFSDNNSIGNIETTDDSKNTYIPQKSDKMWDFGTRAILGGVLFLIAGLIFTSTVKCYQNWLKRRYMKIDDKHDRMKSGESQF